MSNEYELSLNDLIDNQQSSSAVFNSAKVFENQKLTDKIKELVEETNSKSFGMRKIPMAEAVKVAGRSLKRTVYDIANPELRAFTALREVSDFIRVYATGEPFKIASAHSDLLPLGHPLTSLSADEFETKKAKAAWLASDSDVPVAYRALVSSALISEEGSVERIFAHSYLSSLQGTKKPIKVISELL